MAHDETTARRVRRSLRLASLLALLQYCALAILWGLVEIVLLWQLPTLAAIDSSRVRPTVALLILANVAHAALAWTYFFPAPVVGDVVVAACLAWTFFASRHRERAGGEVPCPRGASEGTM